MTEPLRVLAWDHPRALGPLAAAAAAWEAAGRGPVEVVRRSLASFGDDVPDVGDVDLVLIDHPHIGLAVQSGAIVALDTLVGADELRDRRRDAVGRSGEAYVHDGASWAIAIDAACHGMATTVGLRPPRTLAELAAAPSALRIAVPLHPAHALSAHITVAATLGARDACAAFADHGASSAALSVLGGIARRGPAEAYGWEPPVALDAVAHGAVDCVPFVYGYVGYPLAWHDVPAGPQHAPPRPILGGVGMAVTSSCVTPGHAAAFAAWLGSPETQRTIVLAHGGQPADAAAWATGTDPLFAGTAVGLAQAVQRPNAAWWPPFQLEAGDLLVEGLRTGRDEHALAQALADLLARHREAVCA